MKWYLKVLKQYTDFNGRARRKEYWMFVLFNLIFSMVWGFICGLAGFPNLSQLYTLAIIIPSIVKSELELPYIQILVITNFLPDGTV